MGCVVDCLLGCFLDCLLGCLLGLFAELFAGLLAMWNRNYVANVLIQCVKCDDEFVTSLTLEMHQGWKHGRSPGSRP